MIEYSNYSDTKPKTGGAYTGWRPSERSRWHWLGLLPLAAFVLVLVWKVLS